jgi:hypothetical protein
MFYNVENLFDTQDDPGTSDEEFTPRGARHGHTNALTKSYSILQK